MLMFVVWRELVYASIALVVLSDKYHVMFSPTAVSIGAWSYEQRLSVSYVIIGTLGFPLMVYTTSCAALWHPSTICVAKNECVPAFVTVGVYVALLVLSN